jgi:hypothetical protein
VRSRVGDAVIRSIVAVLQLSSAAFSFNHSTSIVSQPICS